MPDLPDGVYRLIEMLEQRFGKIWADLLLLSVVLGAAAWGIHTFMVLLAVPAFNVCVGMWNAASNIKLAPSSNTDKIVTLVTFAFTGAVTVGCTYSLVREGRSLKRTLASVDAWTRRQTVRIAEVTERLQHAAPQINVVRETFKNREEQLVVREERGSSVGEG